MIEHSEFSPRNEASKSEMRQHTLAVLQKKYIAFMAVFLGRRVAPGPAIWVAIGLSLLFWAMIVAVMVHLFRHGL